MNRQTVTWILVILLGVQLGLVAYFAGWFESKPDPSATHGDKEPWKLPPLAERREELPAFFEALKNAHQSGNATLVASYRDIERATDELVEAVRRDKGSVPAGLRRRLSGDILTPQPLLPRWTQARIDWESFRELPGEGEAQVLVSHRLADGSDYHMRWWLKFGPKGWRWFDWEDRELDERFSAGTSRMLDMDRKDVNRWGEALPQLRQAENYVIIGQVMMASAYVSNIAMTTFPPPLEVHHALLAGLVALEQHKPAEALKHFDKAESFGKSIPYANRLRASAYFELGEYGRTLASLARYTQKLSEDPRTACLRGYALLKLWEVPRAMNAFRESLQDAPGKAQPEGPIKSAPPAPGDAAKP